MPDFLPFRPWLPINFSQSCISIGNYSQKKIEEVRKAFPASFLNVVFPEGTSKAKPDWFKSRQLWEQFCQEGLYYQYGPSCFLYYAQLLEETLCEGLIGLASVIDFLNLKIKKHEDTLRQKEKLLKNYLDILNIHAEPVYLLFDDDTEWDNYIKLARDSAIMAHFEDELGRKHWLGILPQPEIIRNFQQYYQKKESFYIADGHHRCAASAIYGKENKFQNGSQYFLAALMPINQAELDSFSRIILSYKEAPEVSEILGKINVHFQVEAFNSENWRHNPKSYAQICLNGQWWHLTPRNSPEKLFGLMGQVPAFVLNELILKPIFEISDLRNDKRLNYIGGKPNFEKLAMETLDGRAIMALTMNPVTFSAFKEILNSFLTMPPKSTWFLPKFLTGLTIFEYASSLSDDALK